jgi:DNA-binding phage protein
MALTRDFKRTILARVQRDARFRSSLLTEALDAFLSGDIGTGKAMLRDLINATVGFERLATETGTPAKSLHRMLSPQGNPRTDNFFTIVSALQKSARVRLHVVARAG